MGQTLLNSKDIGNVQKNDFDIVTSGEAIITKIIVAGAGAPTMTQTGVDAGTGDVTLNFPATSGGSSDLTGITNTTPNSGYPTGAYASNVSTSDGFGIDGRLTGAKNGTLNNQRLQGWNVTDTYLRNWLEGTSSWSAWSKFPDSSDFTAKGQMQVASGNNVTGILSIGADGTIPYADSTQTLGIKWGAAPLGGGAGSGFTWSVITTSPVASSVNNGYITNSASLITIPLPLTSAVGSILRVAGFGAGGWKVSEGAGQQITMGIKSSVVAGFINSTNQYDSIEMICVVANTTWLIIDSQGNINLS